MTNVNEAPRTYILKQLDSVCKKLFKGRDYKIPDDEIAQLNNTELRHVLKVLRGVYKLKKEGENS